MTWPTFPPPKPSRIAVPTSDDVYYSDYEKQHGKVVFGYWQRRSGYAPKKLTR